MRDTLPPKLRTVSVRPIPSLPPVELIDEADVVAAGLTDRCSIDAWCGRMGALLFETPAASFTLDIAASYALGRGFERCVYRR